jgi:BMFP domain-containing protein YqiC
MEGIIYILDQAGLGLAQTNAEIVQLRARVEELEALLAEALKPKE